MAYFDAQVGSKPVSGSAAPVTSPRDLPAARLNENARTVLERRYLRCGIDGQPAEEPEEMFWRVAASIASADEGFGASAADVERVARAFYGLMAGGRFLPNSPTLMNAGRKLGQLSACFVLPVDDTLSNGRSGVYDTLRSMALIHQSGGGTGFSFSRLRPAGDRVRASAGVASGPLSFMSLYDASTGVVKQGGTRRGANMGILRIDHPDIRAFIACKADTSQITNFNISVAVTDEFMAARADGQDYELIHPTTGDVVGTESAADIWGLIVHGAWATGEPGVFFIDRANEHNPVPHLGAYEATNPCGEQPLLPYDVCNLGSVNVGAFCGVSASPNASGTLLNARERVDWNGLRGAVHAGVHFLDNVIEVNRFPLPEIEERAHAIRRIGLGIMGWADLLVRVGLSYGSEEAVDFAREVMGFVDEEARAASVALAERRGTFPEWERSIWGPDATCARDPLGRRVRPELALRHCNLTTVAPTGSISMIAGCSGGIEPHFAVAFVRQQAGVRMVEVNGDFVAQAKCEGWFSEGLMDRIAESGHLNHPEVPPAARKLFVTSHDIVPMQHVRMQAAFQEHTDAAISKTTNFPAHATEEDVRTIFELAYDLGAKGVTVYRDGSRPAQVLSTGKTEASPESRRSRPRVLAGSTVKWPSPLGELYVTVNTDEGRPFEVFCTVGKAGGAANADSEAMGRLISLALRRGVPLEDVRDQLRGIACDRPVGLGPDKVLSAPDGIAQALTCYLELACIIHEREAPVRPNGAVVRKIREWSGGGPVGPVSTL